MPITVTQLNTDEVLRYMGCPPDRANPATRAMAEDCTAQLLEVIRPRWGYQVFELTPEASGLRLSCGLLLPGQDLKRHLRGCRRAVLFCATLGAEVDALIRRDESRDLARAFGLDCAAAAAVEELCDRIEAQLLPLFPGCGFPSRFSPGYGDLPLSLQGELLTLLDAPRRVGLTASASHILIPRKSVTAFLGVADGPAEQAVRSCLGCQAHGSCQYQKAGGHCGIS